MAEHLGVREILANDRITFGVTAPMDADRVTELEQLGVESLWAGGHVASRNPSPEVLVYLSMLAARSTVPIGTSILLLPLYAPAIVAKQVADLDNACGGRLILGIGVGGEYPQEFRAVQVPMRERGQRTNEAIPLIRRFWTGEPVTHDGPFFPLEDVKIHPRPLQEHGPAIVVSGRQEPAIRRAALLGDGWMPYMYSPRRYRSSVNAVREHAAGASRDLERFSWMAYVPVCIDADPAVARREGAEFLGGTYQQDFEQLITHVGAVGTVDDVVARLIEYVDAGVRHFIFLTTRPTDAHGQAKLLAEEIMPAVRSHHASSLTTSARDS
jgi:alkanesulfonate monooxygenase SsuD/methylene tetrahydromethanopterin reductase-like flavin-dependent oxidoreductase (luciferase family)